MPIEREVRGEEAARFVHALDRWLDAADSPTVDDEEAPRERCVAHGGQECVERGVDVRGRESNRQPQDDDPGVALGPVAHRVREVRVERDERPPLGGAHPQESEWRRP